MESVERIGGGGGRERELTREQIWTTVNAKSGDGWTYFRRGTGANPNPNHYQGRWETVTVNPFRWFAKCSSAQDGSYEFGNAHTRSTPFPELSPMAALTPLQCSPD